MPTDRSPLTIAICTHNRASLAIECLTTVLEQAASRPIEVLIVDNSSTSSEASTLLAWCKANPSVAYVRETRLGLSCARNRAIECANSPWIAFLDDDTLLRPGWLQAVCTFIDASEPTLAAFGGPVFPKWPSPPASNGVHPQHLGRLWCEFLSLTDPTTLARGDTPRVLGCNMVLRTNAVRELGGFSEDLGRTPTSLKGGEEIELLRRMTRKHYRIDFETNAGVEHVIHRDRLTRDWIRQRVLDEGRVSSRFRTDMLFLTQQLLALPPLAAYALVIGLSKTSQVNSHDNYVRFWRNWGYLVGLVCNIYNRVLSNNVNPPTTLSAAMLAALLMHTVPCS